MTKITLVTALLACSLLAGCQSARFSSTFPPSTAYSTARPQLAAMPARPATPAAEPVLLAALPGSELGSIATQETRSSLALVGRSSTILVAPPLAAPDTALNRLLQTPPKLPADPLTTVINVVGAAATVGGAGLAIAGASNNSSGYYPLVQVMAGIALLIVGIPLLLLQGKNGRRRRREERRRNAAPKGAPVPQSDAANKPLQRLGLGMGIAAGVVLLLGALAGGLSLALASIVGVPLVLVGLLLLVAGS